MQIRKLSAKIFWPHRFTFWLPLIVAAGYLFGIAHPQYTVTTTLTVTNLTETQSPLPNLASLMQANPASPTTDLLHLQEFLTAADAMTAANHDLGIITHWHQQAPDYVYRLNWPDYPETALPYYQDKVRAEINPITGTLHLTTTAFAPTVAKKLNEHLLAQANTFINRNAQLASQTQIQFWTTQLQTAQQNLTTARQNLLTYQNQQNFLTPTTATADIERQLATLESEKLRLDTEYNQKRAYLTEDSPQLAGLRTARNSIAGQIAHAKAQFTGTQTTKINTKADTYQALASQVEIASEIYRTTLATHEKIKIDATRQLKQLVIITQPQLPQYPSEPQRLQTIAYLALGLAALAWLRRLGQLIINQQQG